MPNNYSVASSFVSSYNPPKIPGKILFKLEDPEKFLLQIRKQTQRVK